MKRRVAIVLLAFGWQAIPAQTPHFEAPKLSPEQQRAALAKEEQRVHNDWADLTHYQGENAKLPPPAPNEARVVLLGDSITEAWGLYFFPGKPYVNRGISGQTAPQMLVRFRQDVIALKPRVVVINAGTNDIAGNTGPETLEMIEGHIQSMIELAKANRIRVVLSSVLPAGDFWWRPGLQPSGKIVALNRRLKTLAARTGCVWLDYWTAFAAPDESMKPELAIDGIHPNMAGYALMAPLVNEAVAQALKK